MAEDEQPSKRSRHSRICIIGAVFVAAVSAGCRADSRPRPAVTNSKLRLGVSLGDLATTNPLGGLRQIANILSIESLVRIGDDGRPQPWVANAFSLSADNRTLRLDLRSDVKFHDGTPLTAALVTKVLADMLPRWLGPAKGDVEHVSASGTSNVLISFRRPSPMLLESLEVPIQKPGSPGIGTGPFRLSGTEIVANPDYYLGKPRIDHIVVTPYPTLRSAWAELLRNRNDMLWEVGADALDSLTSMNSVAIFEFTRRYQYEIIFNTKTGPLMSADVRRRMSAAVDREQVVAEAFGGHGVPSTGPVWPQHWALDQAAAPNLFSPAAASGPPLRIRFTCLVPPDYERLALVVKRQLQAIGVDMMLEERSPDEIFKAVASGQFEAALLDVVSGASVFRVYEWWHTGGFLNPGSLGNARYDTALDGILNAETDAQYRAEISNFQRVFTVDDPPAIFLAWSKRARAVSRRFVVPAEPNRDVIATLRLWHPAEERTASRN